MSEETAVTVVTDNVPRLAPARIPYHPAIEERFGVDRASWTVLTDNLFPAAETTESIIMALSYCRARKLDIFKKPIHIVPVYDRKRKKMVDTVWPAISELRTTAMRTGEYAGKDETIFGPEVTEKLGNVEVTYPEWAIVTVYRFVKGIRCGFSGERVRWKEYYAKASRETLAPNDMWKTKSYSQISKCAEASALRSAFPEENGSDYTADEMSGQEVDVTYAQERVAAPTLMERLPGAQTGAGFNHEGVREATDAAAPRIKRERKAKPQAEVVEDRPTSTEEPIETAPVQTAEPEPDESASVGPASEPLADPVDSSPQASSEPTTDGEREQDEHGHQFVQDDRGNEVCSICGEVNDDAAFEDVAEFEEELAEAEMVQDDPLLAFVNTVENAGSFAEVKAAMRLFFATEVFQSMLPERKNQIRATIWDVMEERRRVIKDLPDHAADATAFRLWMEHCADPEAIKGTLAVLERSTSMTGSPPSVQNNIREAAKARIALLLE